ncbi:hypothetical protein [Dongia deserti]|uniref:hypothetical protein n=1 Tax=Dongia deserti TaxID=2268030 RepID=UPI000E64DF4B|nr:hypothetical protein [Dongia deserti]
MNIPTVFSHPPAPAEINELDVLDDGSVALKRERANVAFGFRACGLPFSAETRLAETGPVLQIAAEIGGDPYSAEGVDLREAVHAIIRSSHTSPSCRLMVSKQKRIYCVGKGHLSESWTPTALLTVAAELVLEARPYLMVLRDVMPRWAKPAA